MFGGWPHPIWVVVGESIAAFSFIGSSHKDQVLIELQFVVSTSKFVVLEKPTSEEESMLVLL